MNKMVEYMQACEAGVTADQVRELYNYDHETGEFTWKPSQVRGRKAGAKAGSYTNDGYLLLFVGGRKFRAHRIAWLHFYGKWPDHLIDHINGVKDDNRIANLRDVPNDMNRHNQKRAHKTNRIGLLGVRVTRCGGFETRIHTKGKYVHLGTYRTAEEAHAVYVSAKQRLHAGFAPALSEKLNLQDPGSHE